MTSTSAIVDHNDLNRHPGWLESMVPEVFFTTAERSHLATDSGVPPFLSFVRLLEEFWETLLLPIDNLAYLLDPHTAGPELATWLGSWVGADKQLLEPETAGHDNHHGRTPSVVRQFGHSLASRGTATWYREILETLTDETVTITESGHIVEEAPPTDTEAWVHVQLSATGGLDPDAIRAFLRREVPIGIQVYLTIGDTLSEELT